MSDCRMYITVILLASVAVYIKGQQQCDIPVDVRFDCYPESGSSEQKCVARGCCWQPATRNQPADEPIGQPFCFYPINYQGYVMSKEQSTTFGLTANLSRKTTSYYPKDVMNLRIDVYFETQQRLHFKIHDPISRRYEVPIETPRVTTRETNPDYKVSFTYNPFGITVTRVKTGAVIFNSSIATSAFIYADQFIQISTTLASKYIYGLGEHTGSFLRSTHWSEFAFWNRDTHPSSYDNLYGDHPFYLALEPESGTAYGVFLLNSNAMDIAINPAPALTYRTIGGILDFYIFLGPSPSEVIQQYTEVIGRPFHPPYWGLGFHLCRWGYNTAERTLEIVQNMRKLRIPQDTQWNDIDYMVSHRDFTYDQLKYQQLPEVVTNLHENGQHYIIMLDPAISSSQPAGSYSPYDTGVQQDVFIKDASGQILIGKVWPGETAFPDFFNPETEPWWKSNIQSFHSKVPFDGIWIDMNEPSNFINGDSANCPNGGTYDKPPYVPEIIDRDLNSHSICASAIHHTGVHYDLHSLYGLSEANVTSRVLVSLLKKRPFTISRSTFPSSGMYGGHWLGDNNSTWVAMRESIPGILDFNLFGIPLVGADICGFELDTTEELCVRWQQLGAFYPFSRNHNSISQKDQDPTQWSKPAQDAIRFVLETRYLLLPYLYTLLTAAHTNGTTVARPLFFEFPDDPLTYSVDRQFMWGCSLLISPVLDEGATNVTVVMPAGVWYDFYHGNIISNSKTTKMTLQAPLDTIPLHLREGYIIPMQEPNITTTYSRKNQFKLMAGLNSTTGSACGWLYWDDGDSFGTLEAGSYILITFEVKGSQLTSQVVHNNYSESPKMLLGSVILYGVLNNPLTVMVNGKKANFQYNPQIKCLIVDEFAVRLDQQISVKWG